MIGREQERAMHAFNFVNEQSDPDRAALRKALQGVALQMADFYFGFPRAIGLLYRQAEKNGIGEKLLMQALVGWCLRKDLRVVRILKNQELLEELLRGASGDVDSHVLFWERIDESVRYIEHLQNYAG